MNRNVLETVSVGSRIVTNGLLLSLTADLGNGKFAYQNVNDPLHVGYVTFTEDDTENSDLVIVS